MRLWVHTLITIASAGLVASTVENSLRAEYSRDECVDLNVRAQELRRDGKLAAARLELSRCADASCPRLVRDDCSRRLDEVDRAQPTIVFDVKDASGTDIVDVLITVDGQPWADRLDGRAKQVDPGVHEFRFEAHGSPPASARLLLREGETGRRERIVMQRIAAAGVSADPVAPTSQSQSLPRPSEPSPLARSESLPSPGGYQSPLAISLAGAGLVGVGVGTVFGLMAMAAKDDAKAACGGDLSRCIDVVHGNEHKSSAETSAAISTLAFVAGGLLAGAGALVYFHKNESRRNGATTIVAPSAGRGYVGIACRGTLP